MNELNWRTKLEAAADHFSRTMSDGFSFAIIEAEKHLPQELDEETKKNNRLFLLNTFMHYLIGTTTTLTGHYISSQKEVEDLVIENVKENFEMMRKPPTDRLQPVKETELV